MLNIHKKYFKLDSEGHFVFKFNTVLNVVRRWLSTRKTVLNRKKPFYTGSL